MSQTWKGAAGLAEDVRYYGEWLRATKLRRLIGHLYPKGDSYPNEYGGGEATVDRVDLGENGEVSQPGLWCKAAARQLFLAIEEDKERRCGLNPLLIKPGKTVAV